MCSFGFVVKFVPSPQSPVLASSQYFESTPGCLLRAVVAVAACIVIFFLEERGQSDKNSHCLVRMLERRDEGLGSHRRRNVGERGVTREEDKITRSIGHEGHTPTRHGKDG